MLLSASLPLSAQSLNRTAAREPETRETAAVARPSRVFTDEDLRSYAGKRLSEAASRLPSDQQPAGFDPLPYGEAPRQDAFGRHWTSAEAYLRQCEERLQAAKESGLAATEASQAVAATRARRAVEYATRALQRAREYRDKAEVTALLAGACRRACASPSGGWW
jgi:hypothetical protein